MTPELTLGRLMSGRPFTLPVDYQVHTTALIGIRGSGKTVAATDIAEEMCEQALPWICIDPVGVWWGLRCKPDGTPGGYPVVIIGGEHGDIPLDKDAGARLADAILEQDVCCVVDMSSESKNTTRKFVTEFCDRLMELNPSGTRHIFLEEAPELVPQKPMGEQKRSLAAVDRLGRLGRNKGYGLTLISQRFATINKDVLTQCENILALRCIGKNDRAAAADWIAEVVHDSQSEKTADKFVQSLTQLENGQAWWWSPQWMKQFMQVQFRQRKTFHPGETRAVGQSAKMVELSNVEGFVHRFKMALSQRNAKAFAHKLPEKSEMVNADVLAAQTEADRVRGENNKLRAENAKLKAIMEAVRDVLHPEYLRLKALFTNLDEVTTNGNGTVSPSISAALETWKAKLGKKPAEMIDALIQHGEITRTQIAMLTGQSATSGSFANNMSALNRAQVIEKNGDKIRLRSL